MNKACILILFSLFFLGGFAQEEPDTLITLHEFEITSVYQGNDQEPYPKEVITENDIQKMTTRDVGDLLRSSPNVSGIRKGGIGLDPVMRGFKFSQINVQLNNGQKIEGGCPNRMDPPTAHIDPDDIREMEIIKGPYALRYGPNFGGVINMKTLRPYKNKSFKIHAGAMLGYESNWNGAKEQVYLKGGNDKVFFHLSGNHKEYNNYKDGNGDIVNSAFQRYNFNGQLGVTIAQGHHLIASVDQSYGRNVLFPALPMDEREDNTNLMSLDYRAKISKTLNNLQFKAYRSDVDHLMDNKERPFSDTVVAESSIRAINYGFRTEAGIYTGKCQLNVGMDFENIDKDGERTKHFILQPTLPVKKEALWNQANIRNIGFFAEYKKVFGRLSLVSAIRFDINNATSGSMSRESMTGMPVYENDSTQSDHFNFSISVGGDYSLSDKLTLKFAIGRGERSPDMAERFIILLPIGYDPYDYLGNPQLETEINYQADLGLNYFDNEQIGTAYVNIFFSLVQNYISGVLLPESQVKPQTKGVLGVKEFRNLDNVWLTGFEVGYSTPSGIKFGADLSASYTYGINPEAQVYIKENGEVVGEETVTNDPLSEIPPFEANLGISYKFLDGDLLPRLGFRMVAAQNKTSRAFEETDTPGFFTLDLNINYRVNTYFSISTGINNIFDKAYYEHLNRRIIGSRDNYYEPGRVFYINLRFDI